MNISRADFLSRNPRSRWLAGGVALAATLVVSACATTEPPVATAPAKPPLENPWTECMAERPRICTMAYEPVCARLIAGGEKVYPSKCNACADVAVAAWRHLPCEDN